MFANVEYRYALRCVLVGVAGTVSAVVSGGSWRDIVGAFIVSALGYAGVGAASKAVEPNIGRKMAEQ